MNEIAHRGSRQDEITVQKVRHAMRSGREHLLTEVATKTGLSLQAVMSCLAQLDERSEIQHASPPFGRTVRLINPKPK